jgi:hypothetical protein
MRLCWTVHCAPWIPELYPVELYILGACLRRRPVASHGNDHLGVISAPGFGGGTWPHKVTHDDDRKLFVMRGQHGMGRVPISARINGGMLACTEKSRWHSSARRRRRRPTYVPRGGRARGSASRERSNPYVARHDYVTTMSARGRGAARRASRTLSRMSR